MYAIIKTGGKQYRVAENQKLRIEKIEVEPGSSVDFTEVLMVSDGEQVVMGTPCVGKAIVTAEVIGQIRAKKIKIIKFRRRKHHMKRAGHRQNLTEVRITKIQA